MKNLISVAALMVVIATNCYSQSTEDFAAYSKSQKQLLLKDYAKRDIPAYKKHLDEFVKRLNAASEKDRQIGRWYLEEGNYLLADLYALKNDRQQAIYYLTKAGDIDDDDLKQD